MFLCMDELVMMIYVGNLNKNVTRSGKNLCSQKYDYWLIVTCNFIWYGNNVNECDTCENIEFMMMWG